MGKFGEFDNSSVIRQTKLKPSNLVLTINNLLIDLLICQTFFHQMLKKSYFTKLPPAKVPHYTVYYFLMNCTEFTMATLR